MSVKSKVEKLERAALKLAPPAEPCETCEAVRLGLSRAYGVQAEPIACPQGCDVLRENLFKVYGL